MRSTGNPALALALSDDVARRARRGIVAEFDMTTLGGGGIKDISGNSYDAQNGAGDLTFDSKGVQFNGSFYRDFILPAALPVCSFIIVLAAPADGYVAFGSRNNADANGTWIRMQPDGPQLSAGIDQNNATIAPAVSETTYQALFGVVYPSGQARGATLGSGVLGYRNTLRAGGPDARTRWRIGGGATTDGSNHDAPYLLLNRGTITYIMLFGRVVDEDQRAAALEYIAAEVGPRGIVI